VTIGLVADARRVKGIEGHSRIANSRKAELPRMNRRMVQGRPTFLLDGKPFAWSGYATYYNLSPGVINEFAASGANLFHIPAAPGRHYHNVNMPTWLGGEEYAYRLRISPPRPDFALRIVPTSVSMRSRGNAPVTVNVIRKEGFNSPIQLVLKDPPTGFAATPVQVGPTQTTGRLTIRTDRFSTPKPVSLYIEGRSKGPDGPIARVAVPAEDRMQAFLWRHLVPAQEMKVLVFDPLYQPPPKRIPRPSAVAATTLPARATPATTRPAFTKQQVAGRLRQLKLLFEEGLLTDEFYQAKVAECEAAR
jgi:hypothetical protein